MRTPAANPLSAAAKCGDPMRGLRSNNSLRIRQTGWRNIPKYSQRSRHYQMLSLACANQGRSEITPLAQIWRALTRIMSIRGENADVPLIQHSLGPISRISAEGARERAGRELHPDPALGHPLYGVVMPANPRQTLRVGQDRNVAGCQNAEKELLHPRRRDVVGRFHEDVAGVGERDEVAGLKAGDEVGHDVIVGPHDELQGNALAVEHVLQPLDGRADLRAGVMVNAWQDVRRAGDMRHAIGDKGLRHGQRDRKVACTVVDTR